MTIRQRIGAAGAVSVPGAFFAGFGTTVRRAMDVLLEWQSRARDRQTLASLSDRMLDDLGISPDDVLRETDKPFWRG